MFKLQMISFICLIIFHCFPVVKLELKLDKISFWSADSGLELKEVCRHDQMDVLIVDGLRIQPAGNKASPAAVLKMVPMSGRKSEFMPFPHYYKFFKEKGKGAVWPDYLDVSGLGPQLAECQRKGVKVLIQVKTEKEVGKLSRRKLILLSKMIYDSFIADDGEFVERPFGNSFRFDGLHFAYDKANADKVADLMRRIKVLAEIEKSDLVISSSSGDYKTLQDEPTAESNFVITSVVPKITTKPFVMLESKVKDLKNNSFFKGTMKILNKKGRLTGLNKLVSRNPGSYDSGVNVYVISPIVLGGSLILGSVIFILYIVYRKLRQDSPITDKLIVE